MLADYGAFRLVGSGTHGKIYSVKRRRDGRKCVVKQISLADVSDADKEDFLNESRLMSQLHHENIVTYVDSWVENDALYIAMDHYPGGDLLQQIRSRKSPHLDEETIWRYLIQIAQGLRYLHGSNILHRDIKPSNIFLDAHGNALIGDLGLGRFLGAQSMASTGVGTPLYFSPELCEERPYNDKSDIWSFGCLVYELAVAVPPFVASNHIALAKKIVNQEPPPLPQKYSTELRFLVERMLSKDVDKRPSAAQILELSSVRYRVELFALRDKVGALQERCRQLEDLQVVQAEAAEQEQLRSRQVASEEVEDARAQEQAMRQAWQQQRAEWQQIEQAWQRERADWDRERAEWEHERAEWSRERAEWEHERAEWGRERAEWEQGRREVAELRELLRQQGVAMEKERANWQQEVAVVAQREQVATEREALYREQEAFYQEQQALYQQQQAMQQQREVLQQGKEVLAREKEAWLQRQKQGADWERERQLAGLLGEKERQLAELVGERQAWVEAQRVEAEEREALLRERQLAEEQRATWLQERERLGAVLASIQRRVREQEVERQSFEAMKSEIAARQQEHDAELARRDQREAALREEMGQVAEQREAAEAQLARAQADAASQLAHAQAAEHALRQQVHQLQGALQGEAVARRELQLQLLQQASAGAAGERQLEQLREREEAREREREEEGGGGRRGSASCSSGWWGWRRRWLCQQFRASLQAAEQRAAAALEARGPQHGPVYEHGLKRHPPQHGQVPVDEWTEEDDMPARSPAGSHGSDQPLASIGGSGGQGVSVVASYDAPLRDFFASRWHAQQELRDMGLGTQRTGLAVEGTRDDSQGLEAWARSIHAQDKEDCGDAADWVTAGNAFGAGETAASSSSALLGTASRHVGAHTGALRPAASNSYMDYLASTQDARTASYSHSVSRHETSAEVSVAGDDHWLSATSPAGKYGGNRGHDGEVGEGMPWDMPAATNTVRYATDTLQYDAVAADMEVMDGGHGGDEGEECMDEYSMAHEGHQVVIQGGDEGAEDGHGEDEIANVTVATGSVSQAPSCPDLSGTSARSGLDDRVADRRTTTAFEWMSTPGYLIGGLAGDGVAGMSAADADTTDRGARETCLGTGRADISDCGDISGHGLPHVSGSLGTGRGNAKSVHARDREEGGDAGDRDQGGNKRSKDQEVDRDEGANRGGRDEEGGSGLTPVLNLSQHPAVKLPREMAAHLSLMKKKLADLRASTAATTKSPRAPSEPPQRASSSLLMSASAATFWNMTAITATDASPTTDGSSAAATDAGGSTTTAASSSRANMVSNAHATSALYPKPLEQEFAAHLAIEREGAAHLAPSDHEDAPEPRAVPHGARPASVVVGLPAPPSPGREGFLLSASLWEHAPTPVPYQGAIRPPHPPVTNSMPPHPPVASSRVTASPPQGHGQHSNAANAGSGASAVGGVSGLLGGCPQSADDHPDGSAEGAVGGADGGHATRGSAQGAVPVSGADGMTSASTSNVASGGGGGGTLRAMRQLCFEDISMEASPVGRAETSPDATSRDAERSAAVYPEASMQSVSPQGSRHVSYRVGPRGPRIERPAGTPAWGQGEEVPHGQAGERNGVSGEDREEGQGDSDGEGRDESDSGSTGWPGDVSPLIRSVESSPGPAEVLGGAASRRAQNNRAPVVYSGTRDAFVSGAGASGQHVSSEDQQASSGTFTSRAPACADSRLYSDDCSHPLAVPAGHPAGAISEHGADKQNELLASATHVTPMMPTATTPPAGLEADPAAAGAVESRATTAAATTAGAAPTASASASITASLPAATMATPGVRSPSPGGKPSSSPGGAKLVHLRLHDTPPRKPLPRRLALGLHKKKREVKAQGGAQGRGGGGGATTPSRPGSHPHAAAITTPDKPEGGAAKGHASLWGCVGGGPGVGSNAGIRVYDLTKDAVLMSAGEGLRHGVLEGVYGMPPAGAPWGAAWAAATDAAADRTAEASGGTSAIAVAPGGNNPQIAVPGNSHEPSGVDAIQDEAHAGVHGRRSSWLLLASATPGPAPASTMDNTSLSVTPPAPASANPSWENEAGREAVVGAYGRNGASDGDIGLVSHDHRTSFPRHSGDGSKGHDQVTVAGAATVTSPRKDRSNMPRGPSPARSRVTTGTRAGGQPLVPVPLSAMGLDHLVRPRHLATANGGNCGGAVDNECNGFLDSKDGDDSVPAGSAAPGWDSRGTGVTYTGTRGMDGSSHQSPFLATLFAWRRQPAAAGVAGGADGGSLKAGTTGPTWWRQGRVWEARERHPVLPGGAHLLLPAAAGNNAVSSSSPSSSAAAAQARGIGILYRANAKGSGASYGSLDSDHDARYSDHGALRPFACDASITAQAPGGAAAVCAAPRVVSLRLRLVGEETFLKLRVDQDAPLLVPCCDPSRPPWHLATTTLANTLARAAPAALVGGGAVEEFMMAFDTSNPVDEVVLFCHGPGLHDVIETSTAQLLSDAIQRRASSSAFTSSSVPSAFPSIPSSFPSGTRPAIATAHGGAPDATSGSHSASAGAGLGTYASTSAAAAAYTGVATTSGAPATMSDPAVAADADFMGRLDAAAAAARSSMAASGIGHQGAAGIAGTQPSHHRIPLHTVAVESPAGLDAHQPVAAAFRGYSPAATERAAGGDMGGRGATGGQAADASMMRPRSGEGGGVAWNDAEGGSTGDAMASAQPGDDGINVVVGPGSVQGDHNRFSATFGTPPPAWSIKVGAGAMGSRHEAEETGSNRDMAGLNRDISGFNMDIAGSNRDMAGLNWDWESSNREMQRLAGANAGGWQQEVSPRPISVAGAPWLEERHQPGASHVEDLEEGAAEEAWATPVSPGGFQEGHSGEGLTLAERCRRFMSSPGTHLKAPARRVPVSWQQDEEDGMGSEGEGEGEVKGEEWVGHGDLGREATTPNAGGNYAGISSGHRDPVTSWDQAEAMAQTGAGAGGRRILAWLPGGKRVRAGWYPFTPEPASAGKPHRGSAEGATGPGGAVGAGSTRGVWENSPASGGGLHRRQQSVPMKRRGLPRRGHPGTRGEALRRESHGHGDSGGVAGDVDGYGEDGHELIGAGGGEVPDQQPVWHAGQPTGQQRDGGGRSGAGRQRPASTSKAHPSPFLVKATHSPFLDKATDSPVRITPAAGVRGSLPGSPERARRHPQGAVFPRQPHASTRRKQQPPPQGPLTPEQVTHLLQRVMGSAGGGVEAPSMPLQLQPLSLRVGASVPNGSRAIGGVPGGVAADANWRDGAERDEAGWGAAQPTDDRDMGGCSDDYAAGYDHHVQVQESAHWAQQQARSVSPGHFDSIATVMPAVAPQHPAGEAGGVDQQHPIFSLASSPFAGGGASSSHASPMPVERGGSPALAPVPAATVPAATALSPLLVWRASSAPSAGARAFMAQEQEQGFSRTLHQPPWSSMHGLQTGPDPQPQPARMAAGQAEEHVRSVKEASPQAPPHTWQPDGSSDGGTAAISAPLAEKARSLQAKLNAAFQQLVAHTPSPLPKRPSCELSDSRDVVVEAGRAEYVRPVLPLAWQESVSYQ
eukprot:jgi/Mesvir1/2236/Mv14590-RA.1